MSERTTNTNEKALGLQSEGSTKCTTNDGDFNAINISQLELKLTFKAIKSSKYSRKSTVTEAQYERIDRMYDVEGKKITTLDFRRAGIIHPAGRIKEMNEKLGYYIPTVELRSVYDDQGFLHPRIAVYELIDRPKHCRGTAI